MSTDEQIAQLYELMQAIKEEDKEIDNSGIISKA
jgi:hypothetical protein